MARLPTPPTPISSGADPSPPDDALSPTTLVLNHLQSQGLPATSQNVRLALEQNARQPGYIKGLGNNAPSTEAEDQAAMGAARGSGTPKSSAAPLPTPPIPPTQTTSAAPNVSLPGAAASLATIVPEVSRYILGNYPAGGAGGGGGGVGGSGGGGSPQPVAPSPAPVNPPLQAGATVSQSAPPPSEPVAEPAGRGPIQPSGRVIDVEPPSIAAPNRPQIEPPADMPPLRSAIERAVRPELQGSTAPRALPSPTTTAPRLQAPPISPENPVVMSPTAKALGRTILGGVGGLRGGIPGAIAGAAPGVAELLPIIGKNLHLY